MLLAGVRPALLASLTQIGITERHTLDLIFIEETEDYSATLKAIRHAYALAAIEARSAGRTEDWENLSATKLAYYLV
ncbi:MAG: hypothetical protein WBD65_08895 [Methylocella sp.]